MAKIILIETSAAECTVALGVDGVAVAKAKADEPRAHASMTAPLVKQVLDEAGLKVADCDAVCLSKGPGSYTGLRVGSSTAKGLCFGASLPLLAIGTSDLIASQALAEIHSPASRLGMTKPTLPFCHIVTMIDARRLEVYAAVYAVEPFDKEIHSASGLGMTPAALRQVTPVAPVVVEPGSFSELAGKGPVLFAGDGALKCREVLSAAFPDAVFAEVPPHADAMAPLAERAFAEGRFEDPAYFEPFYLKQFVATLPRKTLF